MGYGKANMVFREQMFCLSQVWNTWSEVEQVIALYSLVKKLNPVPARFFLNILASSSIPESTDLLASENKANDPGKFDD